MSTSAVKAIPEGMSRVTAHLICNGGVDAMAWYGRAFGAVELARLLGPDGRLMHGMVRIGDTNIMICDEFKDCGGLSPQSLNGSPVTLHLYAEDADAAFAKAVEAGATVRMPLENMFWGDRYGQVVDPFGHNWSIAQHLEDLTDQQISDNFARMCG